MVVILYKPNYFVLIVYLTVSAFCINITADKFVQYTSLGSTLPTKGITYTSADEFKISIGNVLADL